MLEVMDARFVRRFALEMLVLSAFSAVGPILYRRDRSLFDMWEITCLVFIPIFYVLAGFVIYPFRVRHLVRGSKQARRYGRYFGAVVFLMALFQAFATILISPGGPEEWRPHTRSIFAVYALLVAILDFQAWRVLASNNPLELTPPPRRLKPNDKSRIPNPNPR